MKPHHGANPDKAMASISRFTHLPVTTREENLAAGRGQAERTAEHYARLLAAEASTAARAVYPTASRLVLRLTDDVLDSKATLVAAYTTQGRQLWHIDTDEEWPDECLVTDRLAATADWCPDYFETNDGEHAHEADNVRYILDIDSLDERAPKSAEASNGDRCL